MIPIIFCACRPEKPTARLTQITPSSRYYRFSFYGLNARNVRLPRCSIRGDSPSRHIRHPTDAAPRASAASGIPLRVPLCPKPHPNIPPAKGSRSGRKWKIRTFRPIFRRMVGWYNRPLFDCTNIAKNLFCATFILNNTLTGPHPRQRPLIQHPFLEYDKGAHTARNRQYLNFILMEA